MRLVLGQSSSLPRDVLKNETRTGASLKVGKLLAEGGATFSARYRSTFIANIRSFIARHGDELVVPGVLSHLRLEEGGDTAWSGSSSSVSIIRGWKIKLKREDGSSWLRIYEDVSQSTCYQCSCLNWGDAPSGLATSRK